MNNQGDNTRKIQIFFPTQGLCSVENIENQIVQLKESTYDKCKNNCLNKCNESIKDIENTETCYTCDFENSYFKAIMLSDVYVVFLHDVPICLQIQSIIDLHTINLLNVFNYSSNKDDKKSKIIIVMEILNSKDQMSSKLINRIMNDLTPFIKDKQKLPDNINDLATLMEKKQELPDNINTIYFLEQIKCNFSAALTEVVEVIKNYITKIDDYYKTKTAANERGAIFHRMIKEGGVF